MTEEKMLETTINSFRNKTQRVFEEKGLLMMGLNKNILISTNNDKKVPEKKKQYYSEHKNPKHAEMEEIILIDKESQNVKNMLMKLKSLKSKNDCGGESIGEETDHFLYGIIKLSYFLIKKIREKTFYYY